MSGSVREQDLADSDESKRQHGKRRACWVLTACEEELVAVHAHMEEGEPLVEKQGAVCEHGMGTSAAGAPGVAPART